MGKGPTMFTRVKENKANRDAFYEDNYVELNNNLQKNKNPSNMTTTTDN